MFDDFWGGRARREALYGSRRAQLPVRQEEAFIGIPTVDIVDKKDTLMLRSEMREGKKDNIKISVKEDNVSISGKV